MTSPIRVCVWAVVTWSDLVGIERRSRGTLWVGESGEEVLSKIEVTKILLRNLTPIPGSRPREEVPSWGLFTWAAKRVNCFTRVRESKSAAMPEASELGSTTLSRFGAESEQIYLVIRDRLLPGSSPNQSS
jgi:hypothetical protein